MYEIHILPMLCCLDAVWSSLLTAYTFNAYTKSSFFFFSNFISCQLCENFSSFFKWEVVRYLLLLQWLHTSGSLNECFFFLSDS
jgi:hypothetical protein